MFAHLGADVIRMEACQKPDGMRMAGGAFIAKPQWWELSHLTLAANTNKRGITLNLADERGLALCKQLLETCRRLRRQLLAARGRRLRARPGRTSTH